MIDGLLSAVAITVLLLFIFSKLPKTLAEERRRSGVVFQSDFARLGVLTLSLPLIAFLLTVLISIFWNLEGTTKTHCKVVNILPSISASIGDFTPQRYIWRLAIGLHSAPRFLYAYTHYTWLCFTSNEGCLGNSQFQIVCKLALCCELLEIFSLLGLTIVSSSENFAFHEACTVLFLAMAVSYMTIITFMFKWRLEKGRDGQFSVSYKMKRMCWLTTMVSVVMMAYLYRRHNKYCEPYIYSGFALFEYMVVIATICFHGTATLDLQDKDLIVCAQASRFVQSV